MKALRGLLALWRWQQRRIDLLVLWPSIRDQAPSLDVAKAAFMEHAANDPAWTSLGEAETVRRIDALS